MKRTIKVCDVCNRNFEDVDSENFSGYGYLLFQWTLGSDIANGGYSGEIKKEDICCECTESLKRVIDNWRNRDK